MYTIYESAKLALEKAREWMKKYADQQRKEVPTYQVGDLVMLNGCNIKTR
jgi:hypothetical protein